MKKRTKLTAVLCAVTLMVGLVACQPATKADYSIGIIKLTTHPALDAAEQGFIAALADAGYKDGEKISLSLQNGNGDGNNLSTIADQFVGDKMDLVLAIATPAAQAMAGKSQDIPILATAITDFVAAGLAASNEAPGGNISGASDLNPVKEQMDLLKELAPNAKTVGFLYNSSEDNSKVQVAIAKTACDALGLAYVERTVASDNDVQQAVASIVTECDALYIPTDNVFASSMPAVHSASVAAKIPVICGESGPVENGGLATFGISYYNLGYQTGQMAVKILKGEATPATMPIEFAAQNEYVINGDVAAAIGITIPEKYADVVIHPEAKG